MTPIPYPKCPPYDGANATDVVNSTALGGFCIPLDKRCNHNIGQSHPLFLFKLLFLYYNYKFTYNSSIDCPGGEDELDCPPKECPENHFKVWINGFFIKNVVQ